VEASPTLGPVTPREPSPLGGKEEEPDLVITGRVAAHGSVKVLLPGRREARGRSDPGVWLGQVDTLDFGTEEVDGWNGDSLPNSPAHSKRESFSLGRSPSITALPSTAGTHANIRAEYLGGRSGSGVG
jgi:hypothetical protein